MSNTNNSGNSSSGTITITGASSGGNVIFVPTQNPHWVTISVPTGTQQQFTIEGIDWAVPVEKENKSDGCSCKKCEEFFEYAEPNQEDGTLICWACRHGY